MSAKKKEAAAKQTFTFLAPLTNEQSCEAGRKSATARQSGKAIAFSDIHGRVNNI